MKILWVKAGGLVPPDSGGKIRSFNLLRELARQHSVTFFSFHAAQDNDAHRDLEKMFDRVICVSLKLPNRRVSRNSSNTPQVFFLDSHTALRNIAALRRKAGCKHCSSRKRMTLFCAISWRRLELSPGIGRLRKYCLRITSRRRFGAGTIRSLPTPYGRQFPGGSGEEWQRPNGGTCGSPSTS